MLNTITNNQALGIIFPNSYDGLVPGCGTNYDENWKIYSRNSGHTGHRIASTAIVEDAVVMGDTTIEAGAVIKHCIIGENVWVGPNAVIGEHPEGGGIGDVAHVGPGLKIGANAVVGPTAKVYEDVKEGEKC